MTTAPRFPEEAALRHRVLAVFLMLAGLPPIHGKILSLTIRPDQAGVEIPLYVTGPPGRLVGEARGQRVRVPGQVVPLPDGTEATVYLLRAQEAGRRSWQQSRLGKPRDPFAFAEHPEGRLELMELGKLVVVYNFGPQLKQGVAERFRRAGYFHPVLGMDGNVLTDDFPRDHYHHRGLFWAWAEVKVGDTTYDPWDCQGIQHRLVKWLARQTGPVCAVIGAENGWYLDDRRVAKETVWVRVFCPGETGRAIDVSLTLEADGEPVMLHGRSEERKGYGGFSLRTAPHNNEVITITDKRLSEDGVQVRSPWADYSARFGGANDVEGVAVFDHPKNPNHPTTWLLRHFGLLNPTWPALEWVTLKPGEPVALRYRLWLHRGDVSAGKVANAYAVWEAFPSETLQALRDH